MKGKIPAILAAAVLMLSCQGAPERIDCGSLDISIRDSLLLTAEDVKSVVNKGYGCCIGEMLDSINLMCIESLLDSLPSVKKSEAWTTMDGVLHISVRTYEPQLTFTLKGKKIFCDGEGYLFRNGRYDGAGIREIRGELPWCPSCGDHGHISDGRGNAWLAGVLEISGRDFKGDIGIIRGEELELAPEGGEETFLFGRPDDIEDKFQKMKRYYEKIRPLGKEYKTINLKFKGQTICRKDI